MVGKTSLMQHMPTIPMAIGIALSGCQKDPLAEYRKFERPYIERAIAVDVGRNKASRELVLKRVKPSVVYLPGMICVGLNVRRGVAGGDRTVCFDQSDRVVVNFVNGQ